MENSDDKDEFGNDLSEPDEGDSAPTEGDYVRDLHGPRVQDRVEMERYARESMFRTPEEVAEARENRRLERLANPMLPSPLILEEECVDLSYRATIHRSDFIRYNRNIMGNQINSIYRAAAIKLGEELLRNYGSFTRMRRGDEDVIEFIFQARVIKSNTFRGVNIDEVLSGAIQTST